MKRRTESAASSTTYGEFYTGLVRLFILQEAAKRPIFGLWLMEALDEHGYRIGPGTLYPILHAFERRGLLLSVTESSGNRRRRLYKTTTLGRRMLTHVRRRSRDLARQLYL